MSKFATPFAERMHHAERYRSDPEFRLRKVNYARGRRGLPLLGSIEEIEAAKTAAREASAARVREWNTRP